MSKFTYTTRKDGRVAKKVTINGNQKYICAKNEKELKQKYEELQVLKYNGITNLTDIKMKDFSKKWYELNSVSKEYNTKQNYKNAIDNHINPSLGNKKVRDIKLYDIKDLMLKMENTPSSAHKTLSILKMILNDAVNNDIILKNPALNIKAPSFTKKEKKVLTSSEDKILLNSTHKYASFFRLMRYTGLRREEITSLTTNNVDLKNKTITISNAVAFIKNQPAIKSTKNKKSRTIPIPNVIFNEVKTLVKNAQNGLLFYKETDKKMLTETAIRRHLESFCYCEGIKFTCHQLRHSYCTMLYYSGIKIKEAQNLMGHSSADMVYNVYTHLDNNNSNNISLINNYIKKVGK